VAALALFVGPDDSETCDGCEEAVNGNPYPVDEVPEPGEFECMSRCRHMIQLVGDDEEVDDGPTMKYTASIGFEPDPDAEIRTDENRFNFPPAVDDDLLTALQDGMTPTQGEEETPAPSTDAEKIAAFIGADVAIITPDNATEIAGIICDSGLDPEDVLASLNLSEEETALLTAACDAAQGKLVGDYSTWYVSELLDEDDADRLFDLAVGDYPQLKSMYATLAKQGFDDAYANQAITLAELISKWSSGAKAYIGEDGRWYVTVPSTFTEVRVIEKGTGSSGDRGHAGRPGQRGGSLPSHYNQSYLAKNIEKNLAEATKEERAFGKTWYPAAHDLAARYAKHYHVPLDKVIGVFAALSPQKAWEDEMRIVDEFFQHPNERHGQTDDNMEKARRIMAGEKPDVVLTGKKPQYQKTKNFYHNISDPTSTQWVTIDGHAAAMSVGHTADNIGQVMQNTHYETFAAAMKQVAEAHHMLPHEVQAITWLHWRNGAPAGRKPQKDSTPKWLKESEDDGIDFGDYSWGDGSSLPDWVDSNFKQQYPALFDTSMREGGAGSGDFGHAGRPGEVGGSGSNDLHLSKEDFDKKHGFQSDTALVDEEWFSRNRTTMTAWYTDKQIQLPTKYLATLDGVSHKSIGLDNPHVADYAQQMKAAGSYEAFRDAYTGINQDITLQVEHDGSQRIYEGNARALAAFKAGYKDVPVRIVFLGGGERRWRPTDIPNDLREGGAGLQEQTRASTGGSQVNLMHFCGYGAGDVDVEAKPRMVVVREGGAGSGDFGHAGRPGEVGGSTGTGHAQTAANEPGVVAGEKPPWEMNAPAPPRYPGDTSIYSPALPDSRTGEYVLGRRLQGTSLTNDPSNEVALYTFIPSSA
jgi:hypothetical protein